MAPNTTRTISCKAWNTTVEYPSWENIFDIKSLIVTCSIQYPKRRSKGGEHIRSSMTKETWSRTLQWGHNGHDGISNHQPYDYLLNRLFRCRSKKTSKLRVTGLCAGNSPVTGEFPAQRASKVENVSIWWCHHENMCDFFNPSRSSDVYMLQ